MSDHKESSQAIVVSLEVAQKLVDAGWYKYCVLGWVHMGETDKGEQEWDAYQKGHVYYEDCVAIEAPTAEEILEELPEPIEIQRIEGKHDFEVKYIHENGYESSSSGKTLADAAARMWIYMKTEKIL